MKHAKTSRVFSLLALVLAVTMLLTLVGCGGDNAGDDTTKTTTTTTTTTVADNGNTDATTGGNATTDDTTTVGDEPLPSLDIEITQGTKPTKTTASKPIVTKTQPVGDKNVLTQAAAKLKNAKDDRGKPLKGISMLIWWDVATDDTKEAKEFQKATGLEVKYETAKLENYQNNLSTKVMSGNPPSLAAIINEWYPQPITRNLMQPIKNTGWDYSDPIYATEMMNQFGYKGEHYGIALKGSNMTTFDVLFFNKKLLKSYGVKQDPYQLWKDGKWNWDTCYDIAKKCTNEKKGKYGMTLIYQNYWMLSSGQDFVMNDAKKGLYCNVDNEKVLEAWTFGWKMIKDYKVVPTMFDKQQSLFYDGTVAMMAGGSYFMQQEASHSDYVPQNVKDEWDVVPFPSPAGVAPVAACEGTVWGFPTKVKGDTLQAAMWFLRYYLDDAVYGDREFYPDDKLGTHCWEVMGWMWNQKIQSLNSTGILKYGGEYQGHEIQYSLIDKADSVSNISSNMEQWTNILNDHIEKIVTEME